MLPKKFWVDDVLKNGKNNVSKSSLSQHVMCFPNASAFPVGPVV